MVVAFGGLANFRPVVAIVSLLAFIYLTSRQLVEVHVVPTAALQEVLGEVSDDPAGQHYLAPPPPPPPTATVTRYIDTDVYVPPPPAIDLTAAEGFPRGISAFQPDGLTKHLVMAKVAKDDVSWIYKLPGWLNVIPKVYVPDAADGLDHDFLTVPVNKGNEAMVYITYIINHYYALPDVVLFTHAHVGAWHNNDLHAWQTPLMLRELNYRRVLSKGYMSLRCHWYPGCPSWIHPNETSLNGEKVEESVFGESFLDLFGYQSLIPMTFGAPCCAQFAVSRSRILENSLREYLHWRDWLISTPLQDEISGRVMEYLWQYLFSPRDHRSPVLCPREHACYCDGYGICFGSEEKYEEHMELHKETRNLQARMRLADEQGPQPGEDLETRRKGIEEWNGRIADNVERLTQELDQARRRGLSKTLRRQEVGDDEFSG